GLGVQKMEQSQISISTEENKRVDIPCKVSTDNFEVEAIHWYRQKQDQALEHLIQVISTTTSAQGQNSRVLAKKDSATQFSTLTIKFVTKEDVAVYYCAGWEGESRCVDCGEDPHKIPSLDLCPPTSFPTEKPRASSQLL
ncbi:T-cell receptor gamma chain V region V108A, partial [Fukomys damarensis]